MAKTLRELRFLSGVSEEHLEQLAKTARYVDFPEGKVIFREGEPASHIFLIVRGNVSLEIAAPGVGCRRILTVSTGELLGWSPVLGQSRLTATARALADTRAIELSGRQLLTLCEHNPRFGYEFMRRAALALAKRLNATRMQLLDVFGNQMPMTTEDEGT
jgi:CRP-like cAMP-binding protein